MSIVRRASTYFLRRKKAKRFAEDELSKIKLPSMRSDKRYAELKRRQKEFYKAKMKELAALKRKELKEKSK